MSDTNELFRTKIAVREAEIRRLTADHRIQNECIADQHDTIRLQADRIAELETLADARLKDRLIMQESNVTAHDRIAELEAEVEKVRSVAWDYIRAKTSEALQEDNSDE